MAFAKTKQLNIIDQGISVHLASDDLDMNSRGGGLAADIQAAVDAVTCA